MNSPAPIVSDVRHVIVQLRDIRNSRRAVELDLAYREYCEGVIDAAIAALKVITGD